MDGSLSTGLRPIYQLVGLVCLCKLGVSSWRRDAGNNWADANREDAKNSS